MKKLNRREKTYVRLALAAILVAVLSEGSDVYFAAKEKLQSENSALESQIALYTKKMEKESAAAYKEESAKLNDALKNNQSRVLELKEENDANLFFNQIISDRAEASGMVLSAVSARKSKPINEDLKLNELRTYFGFDTDLSSMLAFFDSMDNQEFYVSIETVTITARRMPNRRVKQPDRMQRKPLNGSAVLCTIFKPNPDASIDRYESILAAARANPKKLPEEAPPAAEEEELLEDEEPSVALPPRNSKMGAPGLPAKSNLSPPVQPIGTTKPDPNPEQEARKKNAPPPPDPVVEEPIVVEPSLESDQLDPAPEGVEDGDRPAIGVQPAPAYGGNGPGIMTPPRNRVPNPKPKLAPKPRPLSHTTQPTGSDH